MLTRAVCAVPNFLVSILICGEIHKSKSGPGYGKRQWDWSRPFVRVGSCVCKIFSGKKLRRNFDEIPYTVDVMLGRGKHA